MAPSSGHGRAVAPGTPAANAARPAPGRIRVRWKIFAFLFGFGFIAYVQQRTIPVAAYQMMPSLGLTQMQIGWLEDALLIGYTVLQFPGGVLGQRLGARLTLVIITIVAVLAMLATPLAPHFLAGTALFVALWVLQLVVGGANAPIFPISAGVFETWFRPAQWPLVQGLQSMGLQLGAALTPPLIAWLMSAFDWQRAILWTSLPPLALVAWWAWSARNTPAEHPAVSAEELAEIGPPPAAVDSTISWRRMAQLAANRDVLALTVSYVLMNYVFYLLANWCFLYLVQERHFGVLDGGWLASTTPLAAAFGAGLGGKLAGSLGERYGVRRGLRIVPLVSLPAAGVLLIAAVNAANPYLAVVALALCFAAVELNEGPYWATLMHVGRGDTMAAGGLLNTGGNLGGLLGTPIVAYLSGTHAWTAAFLLGSVLAVVSGGLWLIIDPARGATAGTR